MNFLKFYLLFFSSISNYCTIFDTFTSLYHLKSIKIRYLCSRQKCAQVIYHASSLEKRRPKINKKYYLLETFKNLNLELIMHSKIVQNFNLEASFMYNI
jgi:hypothetical protein